MDIYLNQLIQFYSNNVPNLHHLTTQSTTVLPNKMAIVLRPQICDVTSPYIYAVARPSVVCLSVTFVHSTQPVEIFSNVSTPFGIYFGHPLTSTENFTEIVSGEPLCRGRYTQEG